MIPRYSCSSARCTLSIAYRRKVTRRSATASPVRSGPATSRPCRRTSSATSRADLVVLAAHRRHRMAVLEHPLELGIEGVLGVLHVRQEQLVEERAPPRRRGTEARRPAACRCRRRRPAVCPRAASGARGARGRLAEGSRSWQTSHLGRAVVTGVDDVARPLTPPFRWARRGSPPGRGRTGRPAGTPRGPAS